MQTISAEAQAIEFWSRMDARRQKVWVAKMRRRQRSWRWFLAFMEAAKRGMDMVGSVAGLLALAPIFAATATAILCEDGGPIFYRQKRVGRLGQPFGMFKFRSMVKNADALKDQLLAQNVHQTGITFKMKDDPRVTRVGRFIRKWSIDELPQFYNVLRGEMSLVGPRPPVPREVALYKAPDLRRLRVKPGITCLWQIGGRANIDFEGQVRLDLRYIHAATLRDDFIILLKTVPAVLFGKGAY